MCLFTLGAAQELDDRRRVLPQSQPERRPRGAGNDQGSIRVKTKRDIATPARIDQHLGRRQTSIIELVNQFREPAFVFVGGNPYPPASRDHVERDNHGGDASAAVTGCHWFAFFNALLAGQFHQPHPVPFGEPAI
jgi:hypothetical protein